MVLWLIPKLLIWLPHSTRTQLHVRHEGSFLQRLPYYDVPSCREGRMKWDVWQESLKERIGKEPLLPHLRQSTAFKSPLGPGEMKHFVISREGQHVMKTGCVTGCGGRSIFVLDVSHLLGSARAFYIIGSTHVVIVGLTIVGPWLFAAQLQLEITSIGSGNGQ